MVERKSYNLNQVTSTLSIKLQIALKNNVEIWVLSKTCHMARKLKQFIQ